ncbi:MAG: hypothetical protein V4511_09135 [Bacteroidota bacterium]
MKKSIFLICSLLFTVYSYSQDVIYKTDNTKLEGKVLEVGISEIRYKLASNPDGPTYIISKSDLVLITYQNGSHQLFSSENKSSQSKFDSLSLNFCRNFIGLDIAEFASASIGITFERTFGKKGMFALRVPFSVGLNKNPNYYGGGYPYGKIFSTGIDFIYFPTGQGKVRYYAAPYFEYGMFRYSDRNYSLVDYSYQPVNKFDGQHYAGGVKNGVLFQPTRHFCISGDFGFGIKKDETSHSEESIDTHFKLNVLIGYRF